VTALVFCFKYPGEQLRYRLPVVAELISRHLL